MTLTAALALDIKGFLQPLQQAQQGLTQLLSAAKGAVVPVKADGAAQAAADLRSVSAAKKDLESSGVGALSGLTSALKGASEGASALKGALSTAGGVVLGGAIESLAGGIAGIGKAMLDSNAEFERYTVQLTTLTGSSIKAKATLKELADFGASTPFELPEIARAEKVLIGFGLTGQKAIEKTGRDSKQLRAIAGDIAAGTGQSFEDISTLIGKFSSGATGEAISRFQELGIVTKEQLKAVGIEFDKAGALTSPLDKALKATLDLAGDKFGGGMKALSNTFEGQLSTLSDNIGATFRELGAPIFESAKNIVSGLNEFFGSETFGKIKVVVGEVFKAVGSGLGFIFSTVGALATGIGKIVSFFTALASGAAVFTQGLQNLNVAGVSVGSVFSGIGSIFDGFGAKLAGVGAAVQGVLSGDFNIAENFKKGLKDAEDAAAKAKIAEGIEAEAKKIQDRIDGVVPSLKRLSDVPFETDKVKLFSDQIEKLGAAGTTAVEKGNISEAIARQVPGAVQGIKKIADENGNLVTVYDINIKKVQEYAEEQKKLLAGDQVAAIQKVKDGFAAQVTQLEQNKTALAGYAKDLGAVQKAIFDAQAKLRANPNDATAKKQLEEAIKQQDDLKTKYKETKLAVDENTEALRGTVQQARSVGAVSKEEFTKLTEQVVKSKDSAKEMVDAFSTPIVPQVDLKKLAEQFDQVLASLKSKIETGVKASLQIDVKAKDVNKELADLQTKLNEATAKGNKEQIDYVSGLIAAKQKEIKALADAQKDANQQVRESSKEQSKEELRQKNRENELVYENRLKVQKDKAAKELENEKTLLDAKRRLIVDPRERNTQELRDKLTLEEKKIEIDKRFGLLTQAEYGNALRDAKNRRAEFELDLLKLGDRFAKEDAERFRRLEDEKRKAKLESDKNIFATLTEQDIATAERRKTYAVSIAKLENEQRLRANIEGTEEFKKRQAALLESAPKLKLNGKEIAAKTEEILNDLKKQFDDSQSSLYGSESAEAFRAIAESNAKILKDTERKTQGELALIKAKSTDDAVEREYAVRIQQAINNRDAEIAIAGQNAAAVAQARLKYELDIIEATGEFRAAKAITTSRAEFELRKAQLDKQLQEELAKVGENEVRKLELIARISSQQAQAEAEQLAKENPLIRALFGVRETLYKDHYDNLEKAAEEKRKDSAAKEKDALKKEEDVLVAQLRTKEITLEEYNKRIRALQLKAKGLEASGTEAKDIGEFLTRLGTLDVASVLTNFYGSLRANAKEVLAPVFKAIADEGKAKLKVFEDTLLRRNQIQRDLDAISLAQAAATGEERARLDAEYTRKVEEQVLVEESARKQQEQLLSTLAISAAASFGQMLADGQSFGKSLVKTLFSVLKSIIPILVAQITGFSLASAESVATAGIAGVAKAAALTAALYAAVGLAESAVSSALGGFRKGGFTGNNREDAVAGVVHGQEFVSTATTTRRERNILEFMHTGKTSDEYFDAVHLPRRVNDITRAVQTAVRDVVMTVNAQLQSAQVVMFDAARAAAPSVKMIVQPMNNHAILAATQTKELQEIRQHLAAIEKLQRQGKTTRIEQNHNIRIEASDKELFKRVELRKQKEILG